MENRRGGAVFTSLAAGSYSSTGTIVFRGKKVFIIFVT